MYVPWYQWYVRTYVRTCVLLRTRVRTVDITDDDEGWSRTMEEHQSTWRTPLPIMVLCSTCTNYFWSIVRGLDKSLPPRAYLLPVAKLAGLSPLRDQPSSSASSFTTGAAAPTTHPAHSFQYAMPWYVYVNVYNGTRVRTNITLSQKQYTCTRVPW
jgi:hypothetical protein